jgi:acetyl-CoA acyltransferase
VKHALAQVPSLDPKAIEDAIIGCSFPEASRA